MGDNDNRSSFNQRIDSLLYLYFVLGIKRSSCLVQQNEVEIQKAIDTLIKGRTVIVIAHRLKTIMGADHIVVLSDGKVEEQGTHSELMCRDGLYRKLWNIQESTLGWTL